MRAGESGRGTLAQSFSFSYDNPLQDLIFVTLLSAFSKTVNMNIMLHKFSVFLVLMTFGCLSTSLAQTANAQPASLPGGTAANSLLQMDNDNWSLYADEENKLYYVDFATLSVNLNDIVVTREDGEVVLRDEVFDLPVDTIYEIDFKQYASGTYVIELRSFTDVIRRRVAIR